MTPPGPGGRPPPASAASATAPDGSATIFRWSNAHLMAWAISSSVTVTTSSRSTLLTSHGNRAGLVCRSPSAIVSGTAGSVMRCPARRDAAVSAPVQGSTPITLMWRLTVLAATAILVVNSRHAAGMLDLGRLGGHDLARGRSSPPSRPRNRVCHVHAACRLAGAGSADRRGDRRQVLRYTAAAAGGA